MVINPTYLAQRTRSCTAPSPDMFHAGAFTPQKFLCS